MQKIIPFLWFDNQAEEAVQLYTSIFRNSKVGRITRYSEASAETAGRPAGSVMTVSFRLVDQEFTALNGGPIFQFTPAVSFYVSCETAEEVEVLYQSFSDGGTTLMPLDTYPWSEKYGWVQDKYGVSWQLILSNRQQKIAPCFMYCGTHQGKAEEAMNYYISLFKDSGVILNAPYRGRRDRSARNGEARRILTRRTGICRNGQRSRTAFYVH